MMAITERCVLMLLDGKAAFVTFFLSSLPDKAAVAYDLKASGNVWRWTSFPTSL